jgi:predicted RNase H-like HicB family nuclease
MMVTKTYTAKVRRSGPVWAIDVAELPGVFSQTRRLEQVKAMARDAIAAFLDVPADSFEVDLEVILDSKARNAVAHALTAKGEATAYQAKASVAQREAVRELAARAYTVRDIGEILGISHQRVAQLQESPTRIAALEEVLAASTAAIEGPVRRPAERERVRAKAG